jgi:tetratricopeptide (TPR) repeat protein
LFSIALDHHLESAPDLPALLEPGFRRAAFEIYRNALIISMIDAITEANADYHRTMALPDNALGDVISNFCKHTPLKAEYERLLRLATALYPGMSEAHYSLGKKLASERKMAEAYKHFMAAHEGRETVILDPGDPGARAKANFELGRYYLNQGQVDEAITVLELAISLAHAKNQIIFPASAELATALRRAGRHEEAADRYLESLTNSVIAPTLPSLPSMLSTSENCCD